MLRDDAGLGDYEESVVHDPAVRALAAKVRCIIDPNNPYPRQFTGHLRVTLRNGEVRVARQGHFRGGVEEPLSFDDLVKKFRANCIYGGLDDTQATALLKLLQSLLQSQTVDLRPLRCA
jgi:2-methylcitrate dehydratase PrpD